MSHSLKAGRSGLFHRHAVAAALGLSLAIGACHDGSNTTPSGSAGIALEVAPLSLEGVTEARYSLTIRNGDQVVWSGSGLSSTRYGDGAGSLAYVAPCDASAPTNTVTLVLDGLWAGATDLAGTYQNPTPVTVEAECLENRDTRVTLNLTILRDAEQGFFDVAVTFDDIFCSAKFDCENGDGEPLELLHGPSGERVPTGVLAFACTAGPGQSTHLYLSDLALTCDGMATSFALDPARGPGNLTLASPPAGLVAAATYRGRESFPALEKCYWNTALGFDPLALGAGCKLVAVGTAAEEPLDGGTTAAWSRWPVVRWEVPITDATGALACGRHALDVGDGVVATDYTPLGPQGVTFAHACDCASGLCDDQTTCGNGALDPGEACDGGPGCVACACPEGTTPGADRGCDAPPALTGQRIEEFGADPLYVPMYGTLTVTPRPATNDAVVTYTGSDSPFGADWVTRGVEFVGFRMHENPGTVPPAGIVNGNYFPGLVTCRYAHVVSVIDGKHLVVDFPFNGGDFAAPKVTTGGSGYFFIDNRAAFHAAFASPSRTEEIYLRAGVTYVSKGGFDASPTKRLVVRSDGATSARPAIKLSYEDAFAVDFPYGPNYGDLSWPATFGSDRWFYLTPSSDPDLDILFDGIDLLPPHYGVPVSDDARGLADAYWFQQELTAQERATTQEVRGSDSFREREAIDALVTAGAIAPLPTGGVAAPTFVMPGFAHANDGGFLDGPATELTTDIAAFNEFILRDSRWQATFFHNVKARYRHGNIIEVIGSPGAPAEAYSTPALARSDWDGVTVRFAQDVATGAFTRVVDEDSSFSWFLIANKYWSGGNSGQNSIYANGGRLFQVKAVGPDGVAYAVYLANRGTLGLLTPFVSPTEVRFDEAIPIGADHPTLAPTTIVVDGTSNKKIDDTTFVISGLGLQATQTSPLVGTGFDYTIPMGDVLRYVDPGTGEARLVTVVARKRIYDTKARWRVTLSEPIVEANPTFTVETSRTQFLTLGQSVSADISCDAVTGYFFYSSQNVDWRYENAIIKGYGRATENTVDLDGVEGLGPRTPLYRLPHTKVFRNVTWVGYGNEAAFGMGLRARNEREGTNEHGVVIDGGTLYWSRISVEKDPVIFRNRPTLVPGGNFGEPRIVDCDFPDGLGAVLAPRLSCTFSDPSRAYDLRNLSFVNTASTEWLQIWGTGHVDLTGFAADATSAPGYVAWKRAASFSEPACALAVRASNGKGGLDLRDTTCAFDGSSLLLDAWRLGGFVGCTSGYCANASWPAVGAVVPDQFRIVAP